MAEVAILTAAVHFSDVAVRALLSCSHLHSRFRAAPNKVQTIATQLSQLLVLVDEIKRGQPTAESSSPAQAALERCTSTAQTLQDLFDRLTSKADDSRRRRLFKTLRFIEKEKSFDESLDQSERDKDFLQLYFAFHNRAISIRVERGSEKLLAEVSKIAAGLPCLSQNRTNTGTEDGTFDSASLVSSGSEIQMVRQVVEELRDVTYTKTQIERAAPAFEKSMKTQLEAHRQHMEHVIERASDGQSWALTRQQSEFEKMASAFAKFQACLIQQPSLLDSTCRSFDTDYVGQSQRMFVQDTMTVKKRRRRTRPLVHQRCNCQPSRTSQTWYLASKLNLLYQGTCMHSKDCQFYAFAERQETYLLRWFQPMSVLTRTINASMNMTRGAGGLSINFGLRLNGVIHDGSPAFELFDLRSWFHIMEQPQLLGERVDEVLNRLEVLFVTKQAGPGDLRRFDGTLLHVAVRHLIDFAPSFLPVQDSYREGIAQLIQGLVALGVPLNETTRSADISVVGQVLHGGIRYLRGQAVACQLALLSQLTDLGGGIAPPRLIENTHWFTEHRLRFIETMGLHGGIAAELLERDEHKVKNILTHAPKAITEQNNLGQSPLHCSASWPVGIEMLVEAGANVNAEDAGGCLPIEYACFAACSEAVRIFLHADCNLTCMDKDDSVLAVAADFDNADVLDLLITAMQSRFQRFVEFVQDNLPSAGLAMLEQQSFSKYLINDSYATAVIDQLQRRQVALPQQLLPTRGRYVYHSHCLTASAAEKLYRAGFRDIDAVYFGNETPLMKAQRHGYLGAELVPWLVSKGAKVLTSDNYGITVLHHFAHSLNSIIVFSPFWETKAHLETCLHHDGSYIECSHFERLPHDFRKELSNPATSLLSNCSRWRTNEFDCILEVLLCSWFQLIATSEVASDRNCKEVARFLAFDSFGLTHTCCRYPPGEPRCSTSEGAIIREEESELAASLEDFMDEYETERANYPGPERVIPFLLGCWLGKLKKRKEEAENYVVSLDDEAKMAVIGVKIDADIPREGAKAIPHCDHPDAEAPMRSGRVYELVEGEYENDDEEGQGVDNSSPALDGQADLQGVNDEDTASEEDEEADPVFVDACEQLHTEPENQEAPTTPTDAPVPTFS
ncbi:MAG: hypothetical protein M1833_000712 [Piccolia ochrophora]|nr:MAG: hypothetical protein M1833_000712 [Piccolia ochrophora]